MRNDERYFMITVAELLEIPKLKSFRVLAGYDGLNRNISAVSVMDAPDSYKWLKGGEFILTSGFIFGSDTWQIEHFINNLIEADCSAAGIKKGRFLTAIPENVISLANKLKFPIIEIPYSFGWSDIISEYYRLQFENKTLETHDISPDKNDKQNNLTENANNETIRKYILRRPVRPGVCAGICGQDA